MGRPDNEHLPALAFFLIYVLESQTEAAIDLVRHQKQTPEIKRLIKELRDSDARFRQYCFNVLLAAAQEPSRN